MEFVGTALLVVIGILISWLATSSYWRIRENTLQIKYNDILEDWTKMAADDTDFIRSLCMVYSRPNPRQPQYRESLIDGHDFVILARESWKRLTTEEQQEVLKLAEPKEMS